MIAEYTKDHLGGDKGKWEALDADCKADVIGVALARHNPTVARVSSSAATPRDLVFIWNEAHTKPKDPNAADPIGDFLGRD